MADIRKYLVSNGAIILVLFVAFVLRYWNLNYQSLWLDEVHTMIESDPDTTWEYLYAYLKTIDVHPPLHYLMQKVVFIVFGHTAYVARLFSVVAGTLGVAAIYFLGKEILNKKLGIIVAVITAVNYYALYYSQEARNYIFLFLFATLSFLYLLRLIKRPTRKNSLLYAFLTLFLLYTHYYSLFLVATQAILALVFIAIEKKEERLKLFRLFLLSGLIIGIGYSFWLPVLLGKSGINSFWISSIPDSFMSTYLFTYFGNSNLLKPIIVLLLLIFFFNVAAQSETKHNIKKNPLILSFIILVSWIFLSYFIPYLRSLIAVPMLFPRYTVGVLPAVLLILAYGIYLFKSDLVKVIVLGVFVLLSLTDIIIVKEYYSKITKTQFDKMMGFVNDENPDNYPIINELTSWQTGFYFKSMNITADTLMGKKEALVDSILSKTSEKYDLDGFWIIRAHGDQDLSVEKRQKLESNFTRFREAHFYDAHAELFVSKHLLGSDFISISYDGFHENEGSIMEDENLIAIWGGRINSKPIDFKPGDYKVIVSAKGTSADGEYAHLKISINDSMIGEYYLTGDFDEKVFKYKAGLDSMIVVSVELDNDYASDSGEDRNVYLRNIVFKRIEKEGL